MKNISITRYDNMSPDHKRNVRFSIESCHEFCSASDLKSLKKDLEFLAESEADIKKNGYSQYRDFEPKSVNVQLEREVAGAKLEFGAVYVSSSTGLLSLEAVEDVQAMCNMIESVLLNEQEE